MNIDLDTEINSIAKEIDFYSQTIYIVLEICDDLNIVKLASPAINFRDSINHYVKLYEAYEDKNIENFISQKASIHEHLNRGFKDTFIYIMSNCAFKISHLMSIESFNARDREELRIFLHLFKNMIIDIRLESNKIVRLDDSYIIENISEAITNLVIMLKRNS